MSWERNFSFQMSFGPQGVQFQRNTGEGFEQFAQFAQQALSSLGSFGESPFPRQFSSFRDIDNVLAELFENAEARRHPTAKSVMQELPRVPVDKSKHTTCPVCFDDFEEGFVLEMPCHHYFHEDCLVPWLEEHNTCPVCRHTLPTENTENGQGRHTDDILNQALSEFDYPFFENRPRVVIEELNSQDQDQDEDEDEDEELRLVLEESLREFEEEKRKEKEEKEAEKEEFIVPEEPSCGTETVEFAFKCPWGRFKRRWNWGDSLMHVYAYVQREVRAQRKNGDVLLFLGSTPIPKEHTLIGDFAIDGEYVLRQNCLLHVRL